MKRNLKNKGIAITGRSLLKRISPFLLLSIFLTFYLIYAIITATATTIKYIALPFIIANSIYMDFALWNYFNGRKKGIIWIIESLIAALIIYWAV